MPNVLKFAIKIAVGVAIVTAIATFINDNKVQPSADKPQ